MVIAERIWAALSPSEQAHLKEELEDKHDVVSARFPQHRVGMVEAGDRLVVNQTLAFMFELGYKMGRGPAQAILGGLGPYLTECLCGAPAQCPKCQVLRARRALLQGTPGTRPSDGEIAQTLRDVLTVLWKADTHLELMARIDRLLKQYAGMWI